MLLALVVAISAIVAVLAWAFFEGRTRLDSDLIFNGPSTVNRATAGYSVAILGTLQIIGGVIVLIIPLGVGAALYLEQFADKTKWWNRAIELNIQNLAGVPSIVFGILGLAFFVRGPFSWGLVAASGSATVALLVLPTVILASRALTFVTFAPSFFDGGFSALPVLIYNYAGRPQEEFQILAAAGVLLMLAVLIVINSFAIWLRARYEKSWSQTDDRHNIRGKEDANGSFQPQRRIRLLREELGGPKREPADLPQRNYGAHWPLRLR